MPHAHELRRKDDTRMRRLLEAWPEIMLLAALTVVAAALAYLI